VIDKKRLNGGLFADPAHAALPRRHGLVFVLGYSVNPTQPQPPIRQAFCQALAPLTLIDFLLMGRASDALLSLHSLPEFLVFSVSFPLLLVPSTPVPPRCHYPIQCAGSAVCRNQRHAPTRGRRPGAAPDRRAWIGFVKQQRDQLAPRLLQ
jgi:hypothetical protein